MNRRHFLLCLGSSLFLASSKKAKAFTSFVNDFKSRLRRVSQEIFFPGSSRYHELKSVINPALTFEDPSAIVRTESVTVLQNVLKICEEFQTPVRIRGGGHSFEGFSMGKGVVFDSRNFKSFEVTATHVAVGAGFTLGELKEQLEIHGLSFPTGTCPTVGIGGYLLGGGHSIKSRLWGLGADRVQAMKVILADGRRVMASPKDHSDLYWALLGGGGGNFAFIEEFHLDLIPTGQDLIFKYVFPAEQVERVFDFWERHALHEDKSVTVQMLVSFNSGVIDWVQIFGIFNCIDLQAPNPHEIFKRSRWSELEGWGATSKEVSLVSSNKSRQEGGITLPFKGHSHYAESPLGGKGFAFLLEQAKSTLKNTRVSLVFEPLGGEIRNPSRSNSYPHRDCVFNVEFYAGFKKLEQKEFYSRSLTGFHQSIATLFSGRCYINYPNSDLGDRALKSYFAESLPKLLEVKKKYDPDGRFDYGTQSLAQFKA